MDAFLLEHLGIGLELVHHVGLARGNPRGGHRGKASENSEHVVMNDQRALGDEQVDVSPGDVTLDVSKSGSRLRLGHLRLRGSRIALRLQLAS